MADPYKKMFAQAILVLAVAVLAGVLYAPGFNGPFLLDDAGSTNVLKVSSFSLNELAYDLTHNTSGLLGRPVSVLSLAISKILHGPDTWGFKYHNVLLHLFNGVLLFCLLLKLLPRLAPQVSVDKHFLIAVFTMVLWLAHPLLVSTVLYVVQRMAQLATLFSLAAMLVYVYLRQSLDCRLLWFASGVLLFLLMMVLALLSKENGALILFYVILIELVAFGGVTHTQKARHRLRVFLGLCVALPIAVGTVYLFTHLDRFADYSFRSFSMMERLMTQLHVMIFYVKLILLPAISDMSLFHDGWQPVRAFDLKTFLLLVFWVAVAASVFLLRRKAPIVAFGLGWFLVSHLLESTFLGLELVFEHRNYLAAAGLLLIPLYYLVTLASIRVTGFLFALFGALLTFLTHARVGEWQNAELIYTMAVREHPESIRAHVAYAGMMYNANRLDLALEHIGAAVDLDPRSYSALVINMLFLCGRNREEELDKLFDEAVRRAGMYPATPSTISAMDLILVQVQQGRCDELAGTRMLDWLQVAREQEDNRNNIMFTGYLQRQQGFFYYVLQDRVQGYEHMISAYENTGLASILGEVIDIEIRLGAFETAEHLLGILEEVNQRRLGTETLLLERHRAQYERALARAESGATNE